MSKFPDRHTYVGGTDYAAIIGASPWADAYDVWALKTGRKKRFDGNKATRRGDRLEPILLDYADETVGEQSERNVTMSAGRHCRGHLDAWYPTKQLVVDAKTTAQYWPQIPVHVGAQIDFYRALATHNGYDIPGGAVAYLDSRVEFLFERLNTAVDADYIIEFCDKWYYDHVIMDKRPLDVKPSASSVLDAFPESVKAKRVEANDDVALAVARFKMLNEQKAEINKEVEALKGDIVAVMEDAEELVYGGKVIATWKSADATRLDTTALKEARPDLFAEFSTTTPQRRFLPK